MWHQLRLLVLIIVACVITTAALEYSAFQSTGPQVAAAAAASGDFGAVLAWVIAGGYVLMFAAMVAEGPIVTAAAAFAAALGFFNIWIVIVLAILGDLTADVSYYWFGYIGRTALIDRYGHRLGLSHKHMQRIEHLLKRHPWKAMVAIKLTFATPGLIMVGVSRMPIRKFTMYCIAIIMPKVLLFAALGYYFGSAYAAMSKYIENAQYFIVMSVVVTFIAYYAYNQLSIRFSKRLQTI